MTEKLDARGLNEAQAIARYQSRNYPKPALTADIVILSREQAQLQVLLIRRGAHPYLDFYALPGGFAQADETVEQTAARELEEETGVAGLPLKLLGIYSQPGRDPRGWVVSAAYLAVIKADRLKVQAGDDAADACWFTIRQEEGEFLLQSSRLCLSHRELAFDHARILEDALQRLSAE